MKQKWIEKTCEDSTLLVTLNDLADNGFMPWQLLPYEVQDPQSANVVTAKKIRILAYRAKDAYAH
jgi:hypothetical protein